MDVNSLDDDFMVTDYWLHDNNSSLVTDRYFIDSNVSSVDNVTVAPDTSSDFRHAYVYIPIQMLISFVAVIANTLTVLALNQVRSRFQPHLILVVNLTISDMLFGLRNCIIRGIMLGFYFNEALELWFKEKCVHGLIRVIGSAIYTCTYINLMAMAFDLYFAIMKPFQYQKIMTRKRSIILCICLWVLSLFLALTNYIVAFFHWLVKHKEQSFCEVRAKYQQLDVYVYLFVVYGGIIAMSYAYIRVFIEVRRCSRYTPGLPVKKQQKVKRNKRKIITSLLVLVTFLIAWLPNGIFTTLYILMKDYGWPAYIGLIGNYFATLPMLNCICDPAIYAIRLDKVRIGFRKLCGYENPHPSMDYASEMTEQVTISANNGTETSHKRLLSQPSTISNGNGDYGYMEKDSL